MRSVTRIFGVLSLAGVVFCPMANAQTSFVSDPQVWSNALKVCSSNGFEEGKFCFQVGAAFQCCPGGPCAPSELTVEAETSLSAGFSVEGAETNIAITTTVSKSFGPISAPECTSCHFQICYDGMVRHWDCECSVGFWSWDCDHDVPTYTNPNGTASGACEVITCTENATQAVGPKAPDSAARPIGVAAPAGPAGPSGCGAPPESTAFFAEFVNTDSLSQSSQTSNLGASLETVSIQLPDFFAVVGDSPPPGFPLLNPASSFESLNEDQLCVIKNMLVDLQAETAVTLGQAHIIDEDGTVHAFDLGSGNIPFCSSAGSPSLHLTVESSTSLSWTVFGTETGYDVVRGDLNLLRSSGGNFTASTEECIAENLQDNVLSFSEDPDGGKGFWFLVRTSDIGSGLDTYDSGGSAQVEPRDAEIAASAAPCASSAAP